MLIYLGLRIRLWLPEPKIESQQGKAYHRPVSWIGGAARKAYEGLLRVLNGRSDRTMGHKYSKTQDMQRKQKHQHACML